MGRPIKAKYFGNRNLPSYGSEQLGSGVGGEGFASIIVTNPTANTLYTTATTVTWLASAPQIAGGAKASGTATVTAQGKVTALNVVAPGSGYSSTGSVTVTLSPATTGTAATYAITLTSNRQDAISIISYLTTGSSAISGGDIIKQEASRRYLVQNAQGKGICKLSTGTLSAGQMHIIGSDFGGATYWITKLTAHKARVYPRTNTSTAYLSAGSVARWTLSAATGTGASTIISLNHTN
jgi:hypothetical protein